MTTPTPATEFFHRTELAQTYADDALDTSLGRSGGLFLAAPRRTGKSTFVRQDLVPALRGRGVEVIYVDLWVDKTKDPALLIANAVRDELKKDDGAITKLARKAGLGKFTVGALGSGLNFDLSQVGLSADATLADALKALSNANGQVIVLVIDEAQQALTTSDGINALFALKAARDELNLAGTGLQVIATGSNRDKLAMLVNGREQPFFGATLVDFPKLGLSYIEWLCKRSKMTLDPAKTLDVFKEAGSRPEMILPAMRKARLTHSSGSSAGTLDATLDAAFARLVREHIAAAKDDFFHTLTSLPPLQAALLRELALDAQQPPAAERVGVFSGAMVARLKGRVKAELQSDDSVQVDTSAIQNALDVLRDKNFLWRSQRGAYWLEDDQLVSWLAGSV